MGNDQIWILIAGQHPLRCWPKGKNTKNHCRRVGSTPSHPPTMPKKSAPQRQSPLALSRIPPRTRYSYLASAERNKRARVASKRLRLAAKYRRRSAAMFLRESSGGDKLVEFLSPRVRDQAVSNSWMIYVVGAPYASAVDDAAIRWLS